MGGGSSSWSGCVSRLQPLAVLHERLEPRALVHRVDRLDELEAELHEVDRGGDGGREEWEPRRGHVHRTDGLHLVMAHARRRCGFASGVP